MNRQFFSATSFLIFSVLVFACAAVGIKAQTIVPDQQIIRQMTAYVRRNQQATEESRPRVTEDYRVRKTAVEIPASVEKVSAEIADLEYLAFDWLNQKRINQGLAPLKWSDKIAKIARIHSEDMARNKYFSHKEQNGSMVNNRAAQVGLDDWQSIGENIAFNRGFKLPAESACQQWMNSTAHRENILNNRWNEAGIGVAVAPDGTYYFTEVFVLR